MGLKVRYNIDDYLALPEGGPRYQLVDGDLVMSPSPNTRHGDILTALAMALGPHVSTQGLGKIYIGNVDVIFSRDDVFVPDLLFVAAARASIIHRDGIHGAPDLVGEVLSPSNRTIDLTTKKKRYANFGVPELWIADPEANTLALFRLQDDPENPLRLYSARESLTSPTLPGLEIPLAGVFAE